MLTRNGWDLDWALHSCHKRIETAATIGGFVGVMKPQDDYNFPQQKLLTKLLISGTLYVSESILTVAAVEQSKI